ncbi:Hypothetical_protein [Hexamita inflata]|uniref:Hypothetical_protein n=1 Tax=Hexamita inflata TaxID=28002 RepID=A0AA86NU07_9EUKA|nr:Hypothetical protein HINF_LOCUS12560 [Hexamita inflata]CAI9960635.1 Hypothetical protein HINF_LOCUS48280 [Hexamita inflata]
MTIAGNVFGVLIITYLMLVAFAGMYYFSRIKNKKGFNYVYYIIEYLISSLLIVLGCFLDLGWNITCFSFWLMCRIVNSIIICAVDEAKVISLAYLQPPKHKYNERDMLDNTNEDIERINTLTKQFCPKIQIQYEAYHIVARQYEYYDYDRAEQIMRREQFFHDPKNHGPLVCVVAPELVRGTCHDKVVSSSGDYNIQLLGYSDKHDTLAIQEDGSVYTTVSVNYRFKWLGESLELLRSISAQLERGIKTLDEKFEISTSEVENYQQQFVILNKEAYQRPYQLALQKIPKWIRENIKKCWFVSFLLQLEFLFSSYLLSTAPIINEELKERSLNINVEIELNIDPKAKTDQMLYDLNENEPVQNLCTKGAVALPELTHKVVSYSRSETQLGSDLVISYTDEK